MNAVYMFATCSLLGESIFAGLIIIGILVRISLFLLAAESFLEALKVSVDNENIIRSETYRKDKYKR